MEQARDIDDVTNIAKEENSESTATHLGTLTHSTCGAAAIKNKTNTVMERKKLCIKEKDNEENSDKENGNTNDNNNKILNPAHSHSHSHSTHPNPYAHHATHTLTELGLPVHKVVFLFFVFSYFSSFFFLLLLHWHSISLPFYLFIYLFFCSFTRWLSLSSFLWWKLHYPL